jgi:hypothetical protein
VVCGLIGAAAADMQMRTSAMADVRGRALEGLLMQED